MIKNIESERLEELYKIHMVEDFPDNELYSLKQFLKHKDKRKVYSYIEDEVEKAYIVTSESDRVILVLYFAVYEEYRGTGIGTRFLKEYQETIGNNKIIVLEIENPEKAKDEKEYAKRIRRKNFYEKLGFTVDDRVEEYYFYEYYLLLTNNKTMPIKEIRNELKKIYSATTPWYIMRKFYMKIKEDASEKFT